MQNQRLTGARNPASFCNQALPMKPFLITVLSATALLAGCTSAPPLKTAATGPGKPTAPAAPTKPSAPTAPKAAVPTAPAPVVAPAPAAVPIAPTPPEKPAAPPKLTPEAEAVVYRLTHAAGSNTAHEIAGTTGFPQAMASLQIGARAPSVETIGSGPLPPARGLTADGSSTALELRDWTGLVLVPINTSLSKAYTSEVRLLKVEAHPLHDGRVRVWTRVRNLGSKPLPSEIACSFRMRGETTPNSPYFYRLEVPAGEFRDVFFVSPDGELSAYTVLVRTDEMLKH